MSSRYSQEEIDKYMEILHNYTKNSGVAAGGVRGVQPPLSDEPKMQPQCSNCENSENFTIYQGYKICEECGITNGHVLGYFDPKEYDRLYFRKKSVYQRKYYYEKKIKQIPNLTGEEKDELYKKLMEIDEKVMKKVNKKFSRKRMINVFYVANRILGEIGSKNKISLNISSQTRDYYDKWWESYLELRE